LGSGNELAKINEDASELLEMGVSMELINNLDPQEKRELLKGLLYLKMKYCNEHMTECLGLGSE
jgi:hypothetical protein